ncbi:TetR/AcrR family transcriptional regulator [Nocardioides vastitatis]|uniref:TetR/AcrR family transcriptional regulator n=1 Tax=Nocardioides vastitatis TaxID=2568655 RepID=A0ABW0ZDT2_9ACTN|nr:TetR/AcrR family transcriptional regulator [Nocardioides sp.]
MTTTVRNPHTPTGARILDTASALFYERGIRAVGVDLIANEAGTTKKTLYDRFGSKDELVAAYLSRRAARWAAYLTDYLDRHATEPGPQRVLAVIDALEEWLKGQDRGCAFVNAYAEIGGTDHPGNAVIRQDKQDMRALFVRLVEEAGIPDPEVVGAQVHLLYEGAIVVRTAGGIDEAYDEARAAMTRLLSR